MALSFTAWAEGHVTSTTHELTVLPRRAGSKAEPVAANLIASLVHPDRKASVHGVQFSPDGQRLFASGYPSGVLQIWDWAAKNEVRRIETPPGYRGSSEYALITPDWKTLYVPTEKRTVKPIERDGKRLHQIEYAGAIRIWDLATGQEQEPLPPAEGTAPVYAELGSGGRLLICIERPSYEAGPRVLVKDTTVVWDLVSRKKWKLCDGFGVPEFAPDGKTVGVNITDYEAKKSVVKLLEVATGKELASIDCPEKDRFFSLDAYSPDGSLVAVSLGGKLGAPREVWLLDGKTLADRGRFSGDGEPKRYGWGSGKFSPNGRRYVILDGAGKAQVWDTATAKIVGTLDIGANAWKLAISPDSATLAVGWAPKGDADLDAAREPDPLDLPQPRVTLLDLAGMRPPRVLIAPHGYVGGLAFSPDGKTLAFGSSGAVNLFDLTR